MEYAQIKTELRAEGQSATVGTTPIYDDKLYRHRYINEAGLVYNKNTDDNLVDFPIFQILFENRWQIADVNQWNLYERYAGA